MSTKTIITKADHITFTKLFTQRSGASYAHVLNQCFSTADLIDAFNRINKTSLAVDEESGLVVVRDPNADFKKEIDLFATFAWQNVFLQIQRKNAA